MANKRPALTEQQREQRRAEPRELVIASIEQLRSSDGWRAYLAARARFRSYSARNVLLILQQHPTATRVAGFRAWLDLGWCVTKGSTAIRIWAPCPPTQKQLQAWRDAGADPQERPRTHWRLASVFDRLSRVRSGGCPRTPIRECVAGRSPACVARPRQRHCEGDGYGLRGRRGAGARRATA
jgi:hypothetical protein